MRPGATLVAADGGDQAIGVEVPNAGVALKNPLISLLYSVR